MSTIEDVLVDPNMNISGFELGTVHVEGPVAEDRAIVRDAVTDIDHEREVLIINLGLAEQRTSGGT